MDGTPSSYRRGASYLPEPALGVVVRQAVLSDKVRPDKFASPR